MERPTRYSIEKLLAEAVQPFDPLTEEQLAALSRGMSKRDPLADPVSMTSDGIVIDGSQRLRALQLAGHKMIASTDVRVVSQANRTNALEWAVRLNVQRRHLDVAQKGVIARKLQAERGWSQARIAEVFGVSRPAVSQWFAATEGDDENPDEPITVEGADGTLQTVAHKRRRLTTRTRPHAWSQDGECIALARKLRSRVVGEMQLNTRAGLDAEERDGMLTTLQDLSVAVESLIAELGEE